MHTKPNNAPLLGDSNAERIGARFALRLAGAIGAKAMAQVVKRNAAEPLPDVCHSHDFCDANEVMAAAFVDCGMAADPDLIDDALWSDAWAIGKTRFAAYAATR